MDDLERISSLEADLAKHAPDHSEIGSNSMSPSLAATPNLERTGPQLGVHLQIRDTVPKGQTTDELLRDIRSHQAEANWTFGNVDLAAQTRKVALWAECFRADILPQEWNGKQITLPEILVTFEPSGGRRLGHFRPGLNQHGLPHEVSLNPRYIPEQSEADLAAVLLHELLHLCEYQAGELKCRPNNYHTARFRKIAVGLGIPCSEHGVVMKRPAADSDTPFNRWLKKHGVTDERGAGYDVGDEKRPGGKVSPDAKRKAKRRAWQCDCGQKVLAAAGLELAATCDRCGVPFRVT